MSNINKKVKNARLKKAIKITPEDIKISLEKLIYDVNKKTSSIQKEIDDVIEKINKLPGNKYQYKEKFVIDEEKPNFTNEIDELDYIHEILIFKYAQLEIKLNTLINTYKKLLKKNIKNIKEKNEELQKELGDIFEQVNKLQSNEYKYKENFVMDEDNPNFMNEIDKLEYIYSTLEKQKSQLERELNILKLDIENKKRVEIIKLEIQKYKNDITTLINEINNIIKKPLNKNKLDNINKKNLENIEIFKSNIKNLHNNNREHLQNIILDYNIYLSIRKNLQNIKVNYDNIHLIYLKTIGNKDDDDETCNVCKYPKPYCICDKCSRCENRKFDRCRCTISTRLRIDVWDKYIGLNKNSHKCLCCLKNIIQFKPSTFHCGHIKSRYNGGSISIHNLRPICRKCNKEMGILDMNKYIQTCHPRPPV